MKFFREQSMKLMTFYTSLQSDNYIADLYKNMHEENLFKGSSWELNYKEFTSAIENIETKVILDYGCGPTGGIAAINNKAIPYDPFVEKYSMSPWDLHFDIIHSNDVLEHLTKKQLLHFCLQVRNSSAKELFFIISTRKARKRLPNGANAHATVKSGDWWLRFFTKNLHGAFFASIAKQDILQRQVLLHFLKKTPDISHGNKSC